MNRRWFSFRMVDQKRVYASLQGSSVEAVRAALHEAVDAWIDEELMPELQRAGESPLYMATPHLEVTG